MTFKLSTSTCYHYGTGRYHAGTTKPMTANRRAAASYEVGQKPSRSQAATKALAAALGKVNWLELHYQANVLYDQPNSAWDDAHCASSLRSAHAFVNGGRQCLTDAGDGLSAVKWVHS